MRIERRFWTEDRFGILSSGGMLDLFDNQIKLSYRITDDEFNHLCDKMTDSEMDIFLSDAENFTDMRLKINLLNKYLS